MGEMDEIAQVARERLGFERLRPGQAEAVRAVLAGRDTLVVMATGAGKSAIYQLAGWLIDGATLVISPLISLQHDQIESIERGAAGRGGRHRRLGLGDEARGAARGAGGRGARVPVPGARAARSGGDRRAACRRERVAARGGRGALHMRVGPRLPPRLHAARAARGAPGLAHRPGADGDRLPAGARGDRRAPTHDHSRADHPRLRPPQHPARGRSPLRRAPEAARAGRAGEGAGRPGHRLRRDAEGR